MTATIDRLDPFARELLDEEVAFDPPADVGAQARVLQRLDALIATGAAFSAAATAVKPGSSASTFSSETAAPFIAKRSLGFMLTLFGAGAVVGGGATAALMPKRVQVIKVPSTVTRQVHVKLEQPVAAAKPTQAAPAAKRAAPVAMPESTLAAEQALLETVRSALLNKRFDEALSTLAKHERQFPEAALAEEHDALLVQALALAGRDDDARTQATAFRKVYPNSIFLPTIEAVTPAP